MPCPPCVHRPCSTVVFLAALCCAPWLVACDSLSEFKTSPGEIFRGEVLGSASEQGDSSFIRQGFSSHTQLDLTFDPGRATLSAVRDAGAGAIDGPGMLATYTCPGGSSRCAPSARMPVLFESAPLLPIENLAHDSLSEYTFPGGGRIRNYIFGARFKSALPTGPVQRYAMVFLSLIESGVIEVRIIAPNVVAADGQTEVLPALFGVFALERRRS